MGHYGLYLCSLADSNTDVAAEMIDVLVATGKHEILLLSRKVCEQMPFYPFPFGLTKFYQGGFHRRCNSGHDLDPGRLPKPGAIDSRTQGSTHFALVRHRTRRSRQPASKEPYQGCYRGWCEAFCTQRMGNVSLTVVAMIKPLTNCSSGIVSWYSYKSETRRYLQELNKEHQVCSNIPSLK